MDTWTLIENRMTQLADQHKRMDDTRDLVYLKDYELKDSSERKLTGVINVTGNRAAVFGNTVIADLVNAKWQTVVEGDLSSRDTHNIEQFIEDNLAQADEYIFERYQITSLYEWLCNHVCVRGPIGTEWYTWIGKDGNYHIHCVPIDMRWCAYQYGRDGLKWVAPITFRTREDLEEEFPGEQFGALNYSTSQIMPTGGTELEVRDYWDGEKNEVWVNRRLIETTPNPCGKPPFVLGFPSGGFMLRDRGYTEHEAEDIFYLIRGLNDENNRTLSIEQSLIFNALRPPLEYEAEFDDASPSEPAPVAGETLRRKKGELHKPIPTGDLNRANLSAKQDIQRMMDEGAPTAPRMYTQPPSGAELLAEMEALSRLQNSRLAALRVFKQQLAKLMIEQYIKLGGEGSIGKRGRQRSYSATQLKDPNKYSITYQGMTKSKRQELANLTMYVAAYNRLPLKYNLTNILMVDDPDGVMAAMEIEQAKKADPALALFEMARRYAQQAEKAEDEKEADALKIQSKMLTERGVAIIRQRIQPVPPELPEKARVPQVEEPKGGSQLLPAMLGQGGLTGRGPVAPSAQEGM